jgi:hypothetical protein
MNLKNYIDYFDKNNYCHVQNFSDLVSFNNEQKAIFKNYWEHLVLDHNFAEYTNRERRILRYYYRHGQPLSINLNREYNSTIVYDIKYQQGANQLTYVDDSFIANSLMAQIISTDLAFFENKLNKSKTYAIDIHLFRVKATLGEISPTTSGIHQDGMKFICMHFIDSNNAEPVISKLYGDSTSDSLIFSKAMHEFLEVLVVNDKILYHSAGPVKQILTDKKAYRDLLLVSCYAIDKQ